MADDKNWVLIFAGSGESTKANTEELLTDHLDAITVADVVLPEEIPDAYKGLLSVETFLEEEFGEGAIVYAEDPAAELRDAARDESVNVQLILLWGADGDDGQRKLLELAHELSVPVLDLTQGLDTVTWEKDPAPPQKTRRSRASRGADTAEKPSRGRARASEPDADAAGEAPDLTGVTQAVPVGPAVPVIPSDVKQTAWSVEDLINIIDARIGMVFCDVHKRLESQRNPGAVSITPSAEPKKSSYVVDDEGNVVRKRGRGKPRAGQKTEELTLEEARARGYDDGK